MRKKPAGIPGRRDAPSKDALRKRKGSGVKFLSLKSINNVLTVLHKLLALAQEQGVLQHVPRVNLFKTDKPAFDFLTFEEAERLLNAAEPEWRTLVLLALKTGLRHGELIGLQWERRGLEARQAPGAALPLAGGDGAAQGWPGADGGPARLGGGRTQGVPAPARPLRILPAGRPAAHREHDGAPAIAGGEPGGHQPRAGAHHLAQPAPHLRQPSRHAGCTTQGHPRS